MDAGGEEDERDECDREQGHPVEHLIGEGADLEEGMSRAHIVGVEGLRERQHEEGCRTALFGFQVESEAGDAVTCECEGGEHTALKDDLNAVAVGEDALFFGARSMVHDVRLELFHAECDGGKESPMRLIHKS